MQQNERSTGTLVTRYPDIAENAVGIDFVTCAIAGTIIFLFRYRNDRIVSIALANA
jgi:hypothetical protein